MKFKRGDIVINKEEQLMYEVLSTRLYPAINIDMEVVKINETRDYSIFTNSKHFISLEEHRDNIINKILYEV